jgi:FkbM family methyltransferase
MQPAFFMSNPRRLGAFLMRIRPAPLAALLKRLLRVKRIEIATPEGRFWVDPASYPGQELMQHQVYEPAMLGALKEHLQPGGVFVDLGANEGYFSVVGARLVGPKGRVLAIEPQRRIEPVLRRNFALNRCDQVTLVTVAISDRPGSAQLHLTPSMNNGASGFLAPTRYPLFRQPVVLATLSQVLAQTGIARCDVMKIDIEGWEYEAVLGSREVFTSRCVRMLALELHPHLLARRGLDAGAITQFLAACGYRTVQSCGQTLFTLE